MRIKNFISIAANHWLKVCLLTVMALSCGCQRAARIEEPQPTSKVTPQTTQPVTTGFEASPTRPLLECRWATTPLQIDGRADEVAWTTAEPLDSFSVEPNAEISPLESRAPHDKRIRAKFLWDRAALYFSAELPSRDDFIFIVKPSPQHPGFYEFKVDPKNRTHAQFWAAPGTSGETAQPEPMSWEIKTAVQVDHSSQTSDGRWSVEGRILWQEFASTGGRPEPLEEWSFALCRAEVAGDDNFEQHNRLRFIGPPPTVTPSQHRTEHAATPAFDTTRRIQWTSSRVVGDPDPPRPYVTRLAFPKLKVKQPIYLLEEPDTGDLLLLQHLGSWDGPGRLLRLQNNANVARYEVLLEQNRLIYGMTLHPQFAQNGYLYLISNGPLGATNRQNRISRYTLARTPPYALDPTSELVILEWDSNGHNGGDLAFGPDSYLYHAAGDGTSDSDANLRGQDLSHLTSAMLRIDVDHHDGEQPYAIPADNPFIDLPGARPEIWAYGLRNPWRLTFDRLTGDLWVGNNGQDQWEQVYKVQRGENYGWSRYEGAAPFQLNRQAGPTPVTFPIVDNPHSEMRSLTGGIVYQGTQFPDLVGAYLYGDWSTGRIFAFKYENKKLTWHRELARSTLQITAFRETRAGDILIVDTGGGIHALEPAPKLAETPAFPTRLSETGLFVSTQPLVPEPALIPYGVNAELWSDGARKERYIAVPGAGTIDVTDQRGWSFPEGTVLVKHFSLETKPGQATSRRQIETRLLTKQQGQWVGYSYAWNDAQTDATLVAATGQELPLEIPATNEPQNSRTQVWHFPSRAECMTCHSRAANFVLGTSTLQLNRTFDYGAGRQENQLLVLERLGVLRTDYESHIKGQLRESLKQQKISEQEATKQANLRCQTTGQRAFRRSSLLLVPPEDSPRLVNPSDELADLDLRARSYLHANCAICHVAAGGGNAKLDLEFITKPESRHYLDIAPQHDAFGLKNAQIVASGEPAASVLLHRMQLRGRGQMPPLATSVVDEKAVQMLQEWIQRLRPATTNTTMSAP